LVMVFDLQPDLHEQRSLIAINLFLQSCKLIFNLRVVVPGANKLLLFARTFTNASSLEMMCGIVLVYASFFCAYCIMRPEYAWNIALLELYRTLIIGDGESLDTIGLKTDEEEPLLTVFAVLGTATFNIVIMNLVIAIFTTQYGHLEGEGEMFFQRERARFACRYILQHQKLQHLAFPGRAECPWAWKLLTAVIPVSFALSLILVLVPATSPHRALAGCFIALGQVTWQSRSFYSEWFPCRAACFGEPRQSPNHFLWVSHLADMLDGSDSDFVRAGTGGPELQDRIVRIEEKMDNLAGRMERKIDLLAGDMSKILGRLEDFVPPSARRV